MDGENGAGIDFCCSKQWSVSSSLKFPLNGNSLGRARACHLFRADPRIEFLVGKVAKFES